MEAIQSAPGDITPSTNRQQGEKTPHLLLCSTQCWPLNKMNILKKDL